MVHHSNSTRFINSASNTQFHFCRGHTHDIYITWIVKPQSIICAKPCSWIQRRLSRRAVCYPSNSETEHRQSFHFCIFSSLCVDEFQEFSISVQVSDSQITVPKKNSPTRPGGFYVVHHFSSFVARSSAVTGFS